MSTVGGYLEYRGDPDIMINVGDILSTVGVFSTMGNIMSTVGVILSTVGVILSTVGGKSFVTCVPHGTEHPHGTHDIPHMYHDIPHGTQI